MRMRIPQKLVSAWDRYDEWVNVDVYRRVRRIDVIVAVGFVGCVAYYWLASGWQWAIIGGLMYIMMAMIALWLV